MSHHEERTWFCARGCNVFTTTEDDPECASCGNIMTTESDKYSAVHDAIAIEAEQMAAFEKTNSTQGGGT